MTLEEFAKRYRLKTKVDEDGEVIIPGRRYKTKSGKRGPWIGHIYEHGEGKLGVMIMPNPKNDKDVEDRPALWGHTRKAMMAGGFEIVQDGDWEGSGVFDPGDKDQAKLAIKLGRIKAKRVMSEAQAKVLEEARKRLPRLGQREIKRGGEGGSEKEGKWS